MVHSSQIIDGNDVSIRWSPDGSIATFLPVGTFKDYNLSLQWSEKTIVPGEKNFEESVKIALSGRLALTAITDRDFQMPEIVWIEIGIKLQDLPNGDRWQWNRTGKYLLISENETAKPDDTIERRYELKSQNAIVPGRVLIPATQTVYFAPSYNSALQIPTHFGSIEFVKIL